MNGLWFWETRINSILKQEGLHFEKAICIKKINNSYIGYFTVNSDRVYGRIRIDISGKSFRIDLPYLLNRSFSANIKSIDAKDLIFDKRDEFDWI